MATVYADIRKASNGSGTYSDPWQRSQVAAAVNNGDRLILLDRTPTAAYTAVALGAFTATTDVTIEGDTSLPTPIRLDGAQLVSGTWVQESAPNDSVWTLSGVTASVQRVTWDYGITSNGWGYGFLNSTASIAACQAATNAYFHDAVGNKLHVNVGGLDPTTHAVEICLAGPGIQFTSFSNITLRYIDIYRWCSGTANNGRGVSLATAGSGLTIDGCHIHDCSHQAVSTNALSGVFDGIKIRSSRFAGMGVGTRILMSFTSADEAIGFSMADSKLYVGAWYDPDGDRIAAANSVNACGFNIGPGGGTTTSGMILRSAFYHQDEDIALPFRLAAVNARMAQPTNAEDWTTYACKITESKVVNGNCIYGDTRWSAHNCHFDCAHAEVDGTLTHSFDFGSDCNLLFDHCTLIGGHATNNVAGGAGNYESFHLAGGGNGTAATARFRACQILDNTSQALGYMIDVGETRSGSGTVSWDMRNCFTRRLTAGDLFSSSGASLDATYVNLANNRYSGIDSSGWSDNASFDTYAEWVANIEPSAVQVHTSQWDSYTRLIQKFDQGTVVL